MNMTLKEAVVNACSQKTYIDALTYIAMWECTRVVQQAVEFERTRVSTAGNGGAYDTCFGLAFKEDLSDLYDVYIILNSHDPQGKEGIAIQKMVRKAMQEFMTKHKKHVQEIIEAADDFEKHCRT